MVQIRSEEKQAIRDASAPVKQMASQIWGATVAQIEAGIDAQITDLDTAKDLLVVLTIEAKSLERRIRALENRLNKQSAPSGG
jgi:hypothetical protein